MRSEIKKVNFKEGLSLELEVVPIAVIVAKHRIIVKSPHRATFYHIFWIQEGTAEYLIDFEPVKLCAGSFLFVNKDRIQVFDDKSKHDGKLLLFTDAFFAKTEEDTKYLHSTILFNDLLDVPILNVQSSPLMQDTFNAIEAELTNSNDAFHFSILHNMLHNLLLFAERERRKQGLREIARGADFDYTILFRDLLEAQFKTLKSVSGYAAQISVSEKRLTNATSKTLDKSPKTIIDERVILEAKRVLVHTSLPIKEIAYDLGFGEPTNFIKYFRKHSGKTPIEFRESFISR